MRMNICLLLTSVLAACFLAECQAAEPEPSVYVKIKFNFAWTEMCNLGNYLRENIAKQIVLQDSTGARILPANKIVLYNFDDYCPKGGYEKANVYLFASKVANSKNVSDIDEEMTKNIYEVVHKYYEQKLERYLGSLLVEKIESVDIEGKNAPEKPTTYTETERLYIGLGVGLIIIILVLVISVIVVHCKNRGNKDKASNRYYTASHTKGSDDASVRTYPEPAAKRNSAYNEGDDYHTNVSDENTWSRL